MERWIQADPKVGFISIFRSGRPEKLPASLTDTKRYNGFRCTF
ncbi:hypothetical protein [Anaerocolumna sp. MB42-C2]|nr:hypothetical protein [Anaerocolumna sp. MB42-C2]WMJ87953.1 hypothetical protein RBU59_00135 [Anaerocolumna sp. MB42-C2]